MPAAAPGGAGIQSRTANANSIRLHYLQAGKGDATPVVLLLGYPETSHMWRPLMPKLEDRRIVITPDLRGAGGSDKPATGYDKKSMAQDIHTLVQSLGATAKCASWATISA